MTQSTNGSIQAQQNALSLTASLESLLFVAEQAVDAGHLARVLQVSEEEIVAGLQELNAFYHSHGRGLRVQNRGDKYVLVTAPAAAPILEAFLNLELSARLSGAALEALAIVAYRQPVTRAQIESVRGVDCGGVLRTLQQYELVEEVGRLESVGRPILYGVTENFMHHFGITDMSELPPLDSADADALWSATQLVEEDEGASLEQDA
jgi:segregation and condensation protein B